MGYKGDKLTPGSITAIEVLVAKVTVIGGITSKKMFGGHGIFHDSKIFGLVDPKGQCYLKVNDTTKTAFEEKGAHQHSKMPYFSIPEDVFNNPETIVNWAKKAIEISK